MKYIRTKDGRIIDLKNWSRVETICVNAETDEAKKDICYQRTWFEQHGDACEYKTEYISHNGQVLSQADTIEELCDEIVLIENDNEHNIVYLQEAYDRIDEYHEQGNYEPRLIGRIKVGLDKKAVAEWKENEQGLYDWVLL